MTKAESLDRELRKKVARWVRARLKKLGKTQAWLVGRSGVDKGTLSRLLDPQGPGSLGLDNFVRIRDALGLSADEMIDDEPRAGEPKGRNPGHRPDSGRQESRP